MWPATSWDDEHARAWSVMGRLSERNNSLRNHAIQARRRLARRDLLGERYPATAVERDRVRAERHPGGTVVALLFAHPDSSAMRLLDARGDYFDQRTGDVWDLFFPGYYRSERDGGFEEQAGAEPIGRSYGHGWYFNARDFNIMRGDVERRSKGRWTYSGGTDLVLINAWLPETGEPLVDWASTICGELIEAQDAAHSINLAKVVERITRDIETASEDATYGVGQVVDGAASPTPTRFSRELTVEALGGVIAALGGRALGLK
jgi:hypothetical protein